MRTTLAVDEKGLSTPMPRGTRNGFAVFDAADSHREFGLEDVQKALAEEDAAAVRLIAGELPGR